MMALLQPASHMYTLVVQVSIHFHMTHFMAVPIIKHVGVSTLWCDTISGNFYLSVMAKL